MAAQKKPKGFNPTVEDRSLTDTNKITSCDDKSKNVGDSILSQETTKIDPPESSD